MDNKLKQQPTQPLSPAEETSTYEENAENADSIEEWKSHYKTTPDGVLTCKEDKEAYIAYLEKRKYRYGSVPSQKYIVTTDDDYCYDEEDEEEEETETATGEAAQTENGNNPNNNGKKKKKCSVKGHRLRMRKKLIDKGPHIFSDTELLEMVLMTAIPRKDVKQLAKDLLTNFGSLSDVIHTDVQELRKIKGVGESVIFQLKTVEGACYSILRPTMKKGTILKEWRQVLDFCRFCIAHEKLECLYLIFLNRRMQLIALDHIHNGTACRLNIVPTDILKRALNLEAVSVLIIHNHPSGMAKPSAEDIARTDELIEMFKPLDISVYDHLIIGNQSVYSFNRKGTII